MKTLSEIVLETVVEDERWTATIVNAVQMAERVKSATFGYLQTHHDLNFLAVGKPLKINVCLSDDATVHHLNKEFRGMDKATNVLSFANIDDDDFSKELQYYPEIDLGNIILAYETMVREADEQEVSLEAHFCHLLIHGFLHLSGFDHIKADEAAQMEQMETEILASIGIDNPYEEF